MEAEAALLDAGDLADFDPEEIPRLYERRQAEVSSELVRIGYRGWDDFVRQTRTFAVTHGLDPLAPFDTFLDEEDLERLREESYEGGLRWDKWDHFFVYGSGMLAALTDFLLVRIPKTMVGGKYAGQEGARSPSGSSATTRGPATPKDGSPSGRARWRRAARRPTIGRPRFSMGNWGRSPA